MQVSHKHCNLTLDFCLRLKVFQFSSFLSPPLPNASRSISMLELLGMHYDNIGVQKINLSLKKSDNSSATC